MEIAQRLTEPLRRLRQRKRFRDALVHLRTTQPDVFDTIIDTLMAECHVTAPAMFTDDVRLREAEGRRKLGMSILKLLSEDDPQALIDRMERYQKELNQDA